jgi:hypothetical protein
MLDVSPRQAAALGLHLLRQAVLEFFRDNNVHLHIETQEDKHDPE